MRNIASFTVRIPRSLHKKAKEIVKLENKSLNEIIRELLKDWSKKEEEKMLYDAFSKVCEDNVEYAFNAQKEVVIGNENSEKI
ncbi:MAG: toxin-antitoxin system HicB family antitoxin [Desulfurella sp.]|jgi:predicted CopG family antitoxin